MQGPGENAGVIDIGDGDAASSRWNATTIPRFIEPYQGAATGVGGIMRDVFTMGARPIAMMNALRFGEPDRIPRRGIWCRAWCRGIGGYGNCMGVPTVGGEVNFHRSYNGNILVNAMCVGLARSRQDFPLRRQGRGQSGRLYRLQDRARRHPWRHHGDRRNSTMPREEKRPTVQVGDPFTEKLLLEACLELMATDAIIAIQDMGAAGLTSSSAEMADKGGSRHRARSRQGAAARSQHDGL